MFSNNNQDPQLSTAHSYKNSEKGNVFKSAKKLKFDSYQENSDMINSSLFNDVIPFSVKNNTSHNNFLMSHINR
jgi:hypothetical protein